MNPELTARWDEIAPLIDAALDLPEAERTGFVATIADPRLRELLRELLAASTQRGVLDGDSNHFAKALTASEAALPAKQIGPYRLIRLIGEGGSGSVFLAERDADGYIQQVALKLLRLGVRDPIEQERFRRERRLLARLQHPNIARLLDGGFDEHGVPWFAMELIDGLPLTTWCDRQRLGIDRRLAMFETVCAAIEHAHRALIVHRDIKPQNILVDAEGRPHLLDFGIARLIDSDTDTTPTQTVSRRLTPAYAAPEQFEGGATTTATDVHALGVVLHELLVGSRPSRSDDGEARPLSGALPPVGDPAGLAGMRATSPSALKRSLRGDTETIVAKALAVDPRNRYASVEALRDDVERLRRGFPVKARRTPWWRRIAKLVQRQRVATTLALLLLVSLVAGVWATWHESVRSRLAAQHATHEAGRAEAAKDFVLALFGGIRPDESRGRAIGARELLERGESRLAETLASQPQLESELSTVLAGAWRQLGNHERASALVERAVQVASDANARRAAYRELGEVRSAQGRPDEADAALRLAINEAATPREATPLQVRLAEILADRGQPEPALNLIAAAMATDAGDAAAMARDTAALGRIRFHAGDLPGAEAALRDALARAIATDGEPHTNTAGIAHDLGVVLLQRGQTIDAAAFLERAMSTRIRLLGERHPDVAQTRFNLAAARQRLGDADGARAQYRQALAVQRELLGDAHADVASSLNSLAALDYQQGRLDDAIQGAAAAIDVAIRAYGAAHPIVATMLGNLASFERAAGRIADAERDQRAALAATEAALGPGHYLNGVVRVGLAGVLVEQGRDDEALMEQRRAVAILDEGLGPDHIDAQQARAALADTLLRRNHIDEARSWLPSSAVSGPDPRAARVELVRLRLLAAEGGCNQVTGQVDAVTKTLARAAALRGELAGAEMLLATCLLELGRNDDATAAIVRADAVIAQLAHVPRRLAAERARLR